MTTPVGRRVVSALCPFSITVEPMAAMLNFELADDPIYSGAEVQRFDDANHGVGIAVLLVRRADGLVDVYRQPGLRLDQDSYRINAGLGEWREAAIEPALLDVSATGVVVDVGFLDAAGRHVVVRADDRDGHVRAPAALLAPVSAAVEHPTSMLIVWMPRFDLMRTGGQPVEIRFGGRDAATGRLPAARLHRRRLIKYAADLAIVRLNPAHDGPIAHLDLDAPAGVVATAPDGGPGIAGVTAAAGGHHARLVLDPPLPDLARLSDGETATGTWRVAIDNEPSVVSGSWSARRVARRVDLELVSTAPWRPGPLPLLMRVVTRIVPTFRQWPRTYRWHATLALGEVPWLTSGWRRSEGAGAGAYGRVMRIPSR